MGIEEITTKVAGLDILENKYKHAKYVTKHEFPELTAMCPVTQLPDFYNMKLEYEPDESLVELKSLKLYLNTFREREILHEEITNEILEKLVRVINPRWIRMVMKANIRGGIQTTITRYWKKGNGDIIENTSNSKNPDSNESNRI